MKAAPEALRFDFETQSVDWDWKGVEEDYFNSLYIQWLREFPETAVEITVDCKSMNCQLTLNQLASGKKMSEEIGSFMSKMQGTKRPFNLLYLNPMKNQAVIATKRIDTN